jgi:hypothetical protein
MKEFKMELLIQIKNSYFETGFLSLADKFLDESIKKHGNLCFKWAYELYQDNHTDEELVLGLLRILAHIPSNKITPECINIAKKSIMQESSSIKESAIMAFENWEYTDAIPLLEKTHFNDSFLDGYLQGVIRDLKELKRHTFQRE